MAACIKCILCGLTSTEISICNPVGMTRGQGMIRVVVVVLVVFFSKDLVLRLKIVRKIDLDQVEKTLRSPFGEMTD